MSRWIVVACAVGVSGLVSQPSVAGPDWFEDSVGDAGTLPGSSQETSGDEPIQRIRGTLGGFDAPVGGGPDFQDMFLIQIDDPMNFSATTVGPDGAAAFDSLLFLFDADGFGLLGSDDTPVVIIGVAGKLSTVSGSTLGSIATDGTKQTIPGKGLYHLAICAFDDAPLSGGKSMFSFDFVGEVSGPDGDSQGAIGAWTGPTIPSFGAPPPPGPVTGGQYIIFLEGVSPALPGTIGLAADIKPAGCPNPLNPGSNGVLPVSILGTDSFDVNSIDISTISLARADGVGGSVPPHEGPPGPHTTYGDTTAPFVATGPCDCADLDGDGITDLNLKFRTSLLSEALMLHDEPGGSGIEFVISGLLLDGTAFEAHDCVTLVPVGLGGGGGALAVNAPASSPLPKTDGSQEFATQDSTAVQIAPSGEATHLGLIVVWSEHPDEWVEISPVDTILDGGGFGSFVRQFEPGTVVTLSAGELSSGVVFDHWVVNGRPAYTNGATLNVTAATTPQVIEAKYVQKK